MAFMKIRGFATGALLALILFLLTASVGAQNAVDGFNPNANNRVDVVATQPDGRILIAGIYSSTSGSNNAGLARLNPDGTLDTTFVPPQIFSGFSPVRAIAIQNDGKIVLGGFFKTPAPFIRTNMVRLLPDGAVDTTFVADADNTVNDLLILPGGRMLVGGYFRVVNGQARQGIVRLENNGALDGAFTVTANQGVQAMLQQPDGKVLLSGQFTSLGGQTRKGLARLHSDGALDLAFDPGAILNPSPNDGVHSLALQADGRILAAGFFYISNSFNRRQLLRFYPNGAFDSSFPAFSNTTVRVVAVQPDGKILVGGFFTNLLGQPRTHLARLNCEGSLEAAFSPNISANQSPGVSALAIQPDGKIIVAGGFTNLAGYARNNIGRLYPDGSTDATLNPMPPMANNDVNTVAVQSDGKILVGGAFTELAGISRNSIARLNPDGSLDDFNPGANSIVWNFAVQPDGRILVGGFFTNMAGEVRNHLARLHCDGRLDRDFNPGADDAVRSLVFQRDERILVVGDFLMLGGQQRSRLARLDANGNLDPTFNPGANGGIRALAIQADDKIIVGGFFTEIAGHSRRRVARLNLDGSIDPDFDPGADNWVRCVVVLPDGRMLVAGQFQMLGGQPRDRIGRLLANGAIDPTFNPGANEQIWSLTLDVSGKVVVAGSFTTLAGQPCNRIGRLNPDGTLDATFGSGASDLVWAAALQSDGKMIAGGGFFLMNGQPREGIARLTGGSAAFQSLTIDDTGTVITWARGGAAPEIDLVTFERSTDGTNYTALGDGARIPGGWQLGDTWLPTGQKVYVRARGRSFGGTYSTSSGIVESVAQFYRIPQPYISSVSRLSSGAFQFSFDNDDHQPFAVLANTNLVSSSWDVIGYPTNAGGGLYQFIDPAINSLPQRFYQLRGP